MDIKPDRHELKQYLLGEINDPERLEAFEEYFVDQELYEKLLSVEDELFDQYVRGSLAPGEREKFASYIQRLPDGQEKMKFAVAFKQALDQNLVGGKEVSAVSAPQAALVPVVAEVAPAPSDNEAVAAPSPAAKVASVPTSLMASLWRFLQRPAFAASLAAGLLVAFAALFYLLIHRQEILDENRLLSEQLARRDSDNRILQEKMREMEKSLQATNEQLTRQSEELEQERQRGDQQVQEIARLRAEPSPVDEWTLEASSRKAVAAPDEVTLRGSAKVVRIRIPLGSDEPAGNYSAVIQSLEKNVIFQKEGIPVPAAAGQRTISLRIAANRFTAGTYKLTLIAPDGVGFEYYFKVVKR